jgi:3-oxoacyl-[acyl-carrier protein] reductase
MGTRGGVVVNVSSLSAIAPAPGIGFYGASKAMLSYLTAQLAVELGPRIRVNAVAPALVKTSFARVLYEGREDEVADRYPLRRLGAGADIARAVTFLASEESSWITGQTMVLDGGLSLVTADAYAERAANGLLPVSATAS